MPINFSVGDTLYKYTLKKRLGSGNFGEVWLAHDSTIDCDIAIKILPAKDFEINSILQESKTGNKFNHLNLVKVHYADILESDETNYIILAMDYYKNGSITSKYNTNNFIPLSISIKYIIEILRGLAYIHSNGFFHNDIKPKNILIANTGQAVLTDYGISAKSTNNKSATAPSVYYPHIPPELLKSDGNMQVSIQTDIYQAGLTFFRLLNGTNQLAELFRADQKCFLNSVKNGKLINDKDYLAFIPKKVRNIIKKATNIDPSKRYKSATEMQRDLEKIAYRGYWSSNDLGELIGSCSKYQYRFEKNLHSHDRYSFIAYKKSKTSNIETKISQFTKKNITFKEAESLCNKFLLWVVEGK